MEFKGNAVISSDSTDIVQEVEAGFHKRTGKKPAIVSISETRRTELDALTRKTTAPIAMCDVQR